MKINWLLVRDAALNEPIPCSGDEMEAKELMQHFYSENGDTGFTLYDLRGSPSKRYSIRSVLKEEK